MLLCRTGPLPCKSGKTWAAIFLPLASPLIVTASVKICYALPRSRPPLFYLISAEAILLTKEPHPTLSKGEDLKKANSAIIKSG
jgi:hypothetical protein